MKISELYFNEFGEDQRSMACSLESLHFCGRLIDKFHLKTILDAGSGLSSVFFHRHAAQVTSVDDNEMWAKKTMEFLTNTLSIQTEITSIQAIKTDIEFDFVFYDYGDIETRIFYFKTALNLTRRFMYIDDVHVPFYRKFIETRCSKYILKFLPETQDSYGRLGALLIKDILPLGT